MQALRSSKKISPSRIEVDNPLAKKPKIKKVNEEMNGGKRSGGNKIKLFK